jgi:UDP-glucose 4-epimerase
VYGERQNIGDRYRNVVGIFMNQIMKGEPMTIFGDGQQQRAFSHISDVAPLIAQCVEIPAARNETFNVGADEPCTVNELARTVASVMDVECHVRHLAPRNEVKLAFANHGKAEQVFGRHRNVPLKEGIRQMAEWVRMHGARESHPFANIEISRNLPASWAEPVTALSTS